MTSGVIGASAELRAWATDAASTSAPVAKYTFVTASCLSGPAAALVGSPIVNPTPDSALVARPAAPLMFDALATMTVPPVTTNGADVAVVSAGSDVAVVAAVLSVPEVPSVEPDVFSGSPPLPLALPPSSLMLRRIKKPTITATTAITMLMVEPMGAPPPLDFAGGRRTG